MRHAAQRSGVKEFLAASRPHAAWIGNPSLGSTEKHYSFRFTAKRGLSELRENQKARRTTSDPHKGLGHGDRCRGCALDTHIVVSVFSFTE
jgi:hypothetical protein